MQKEIKRKHNLKTTLQLALEDISYLEKEAKLLKADRKVLNEIYHVEKRLTKINYTPSRVNDVLKQEMPKIKVIKEKVKNLNKHYERKIFIGMLLSFSPKMAFYLSLYIDSLPHNLFSENESLYVSVGIAMLIIWSVIFYYFYKMYVYCDKKYVIPYIQKYPQKEKRIRYLAIATFLFACSQPLFISIETMHQIVSPSWSKFFYTIYSLFIQMCTGSFLASICTVITITPLVLMIYKKIEAKIKKP